MNLVAPLITAILALVPALANSQTGSQATKEMNPYSHRPLGGSPVPCGGVCAPTITIEMKEDGTCLARAPDLIFTVPSIPLPTRQKIVWTLDPPTGRGTFEFISPGIYVSKDPSTQIQPGGFGNGSGNTSHASYHMHNLVTKEQEAHYVPVVLHLDTHGNPAICAAIDPKIVNGKADSGLTTR